jgi:hypothetical protein
MLVSSYLLTLSLSGLALGSCADHWMRLRQNTQPPVDSSRRVPTYIGTDIVGRLGADMFMQAFIELSYQLTQTPSRRKEYFLFSYMHVICMNH